MKFKYLMIAFIIIIVIVILTMALLPVLLAGPESAVSFRYVTLPLILVMGLLLIGMTVFFLLNYRLLSLLEREDWPALSYYLEQIVYVKGRYNAYRVKILASSYLVITDYTSVIKLESKAMLAKPSVVGKNALIFGAARVLSGDSKGAAVFFHTYMDKGNKYEKQWMHWFFAFSQLISGEFNSAEQEFMSMAVSSKDALITGLSSYFLQSSVAKYSLRPEECRAIADNGRRRITKSIKTIDLWTKEADRMGTDIHIAIVRKYIDEAGLWLYPVPVSRETFEPKPIRSARSKKSAFKTDDVQDFDSEKIEEKTDYKPKIGEYGEPLDHDQDDDKDKEGDDNE